MLRLAASRPARFGERRSDPGQDTHGCGLRSRELQSKAVFGTWRGPTGSTRNNCSWSPSCGLFHASQRFQACPCALRETRCSWVLRRIEGAEVGVVRKDGEGQLIMGPV